MSHLLRLVTLLLKLFVLGLVIRMVMSWVRSPRTAKLELFLDRIYNPVLRPIRQIVKPITLNTSPRSYLDLAPLILILLIWWLIHPLLIWLLS